MQIGHFDFFCYLNVIYADNLIVATQLPHLCAFMTGGHEIKGYLSVLFANCTFYDFHFLYSFLCFYIFILTLQSDIWNVPIPICPFCNYNDKITKLPTIGQGYPQIGKSPLVPTFFRCKKLFNTNGFRGFPHNILRVWITCGKATGPQISKNPLVPTAFRCQKPFSTNAF